MVEQSIIYQNMSTSFQFDTAQTTWKLPQTSYNIWELIQVGSWCQVICLLPHDFRLCPK